MKIKWDSWDDRAQDFKENADYFVVCWRRNLRYKKVSYATLPKARAAAQIAANFLKRPVMIYAVKMLSDNYGSDSWIENVYPYEPQKTR